MDPSEDVRVKVPVGQRPAPSSVATDADAIKSASPAAVEETAENAVRVDPVVHRSIIVVRNSVL